MRNNREWIENICIVILALIATMAINLNMARDIYLLDSFNGNDVIYVFMLVVYFISIKKAVKIKDKRLIIFSCVLRYIIQ